MKMRAFSIRGFLLSLITAVGALCIFLLAAEGVTRVLDRGAREAVNKRDEAVGEEGNRFRLPLPAGPKGEGEFRILAMGDSYTWGDGITDPGQTWPAVLERMFGADAAAKDIRVINMGICGLTTVNEFELLARVGRRLDPDLVIVEYLVNDVLPSGPNLMRVGERWLSEGKRANLIRNAGLHAFLKKRSYFYAFLNDRFLALQRRLWPPRDWEDLYADDFAGWIAMRKAVLAMKGLAAEDGFDILFVQFPVFSGGMWEGGTFPYHDIYEKVARFIRAAGMRVIELAPAFAGQERDAAEWRVSAGNAHPGVEAHAFIAGVIRDSIIKSRLLK